MFEFYYSLYILSLSVSQPQPQSLMTSQSRLSIEYLIPTYIILRLALHSHLSQYLASLTRFNTSFGSGLLFLTTLYNTRRRTTVGTNVPFRMTTRPHDDALNTAVTCCSKKPGIRFLYRVHPAGSWKRD